MLSLPVERSYSYHLVSVGHASDPHPLPLPQMPPSVLYPSASVSSQSARNLYSVQCPPGRNLLSLFQASAGGTLNINPHGNFILNVQFGNRSQSEYDSCDDFDKQLLKNFTCSTSTMLLLSV